MRIMEKLACLGIKLDASKNKESSDFKQISTKDSSVLVYVLSTDEELMIARDTLNIIKHS